MVLTNFLFTPTEIEYTKISGEVKTQGSVDAGNCTTLARKIMLNVMQFRRIASPEKSCDLSQCEACFTPHLRQIISTIKSQQPISFVLPAFPGKSPNPAKVLGTLPDMAEQLSLEFLNHLCHQIQKIYSPGARVILCSDGRVFNDVVGMQEIHVTDYQRALSLLIKKMSFTSISTFNLDDLYSEIDFNHMRNRLMEQYGEPIDHLKVAIRNGSKSSYSIEDEEVHRQYCGITRFLVEDAIRPGQTYSRNALQKVCRERAYVVIQRSRAWSKLIAEIFPHAVRLSIHPQTCGTSKLGIRLMNAESWMTPWHGVAVDIGGSFVLLKRAQAENLGARLVYRDGQKSHYELINKPKLSKQLGVFHGV